MTNIAEAAQETRALDILESVKATFAAKGFDGASMQDLARGAGMSAGNFYRYFSSKQAIVEAIVERELVELRAKFAEVAAADDPLAAFRHIVRGHVDGGESELDNAIFAEIQAAAVRRPELGEILQRMELEILRSLAAVIGRIAGVPEAEAQARYLPHARLVVLLVQGVATRSCGARRPAGEPPDRELAALVVRMIEHIIAEVVAGASPGPDARPASKS